MIKLILTTAMFISSIFIVKSSETDIKLDKIEFNKYPATVQSIPKAKLNLASHPYGKTFKSKITEKYKSESINFGGHYILILWGAGSGMKDGVIVDAIDGKISSLPINEDNAILNCSFNENKNILFKNNSNLLVTIKCDRIGEYDDKTDTQKIQLTFYYYKWDGKKFIFINKKIESSIEDNSF